MQLTENDKMFLQTLQIKHKERRDDPTHPKALKISKGMLSKDLLELFEIQPNSQGFWCYDIYVDFEPMIREAPAKDWQDVDKVKV